MSLKICSYVLLFVLFVFGILPLFSLLATSVLSEQGLSLSGYKILLGDATFWHHAFNALILALFVAFSATLVGFMLALLLGKSRVPFRMLWLFLLFIPLLLPPYITAYGWYLLVGRTELLFGFWGSAWVLFSVYMPVSLLISLVFLRQINPRLEEAALLVASWPRVLLSISFALMRPALRLSFMLIFILSISELSVPQFLHYDTFITQSFIHFSAFYDFKTAIIYALPQLLLVFLVLWLVSSLSRNFSYAQSRHQSLYIPLGRYKMALLFLLLSLTTLITLLPLSALFFKSTLPLFMRVLSENSGVILRSLTLSGCAALLLTLFGFFAAFTIVFRTFNLYTLLKQSIFFIFILSSTLIGIALIRFFNQDATLFIYHSIAMLLIAYTLKYLLLSTQIMALNLQQIPLYLIQAAELVGASWIRRVSSILLPLSKKGLYTSLIIGYIFTLRESTLPMLLAPPGETTLSVTILTRMANGSEAYIASLCLIMLMLLFVPLLAFKNSLKSML